MSLLIRGASEVVRISDSGELFKRGARMGDVAPLRGSGGEGISIAVDCRGRIQFVGPDSAAAERFRGATWGRVIDASGKCVIPGLVDAHTHPVWAGDRIHEFVMKLSGASYMEVHESGGGIHFTVEKTRAADEETLARDLLLRLHRMSRAGTTLAECKSGYGLDLPSELKMLRAIERARPDAPLTISSTFCGAHAVPKGKTSTEAAADIVHNQLPAVKSLVDSGQLQVESVDVFCERGVFSVSESRSILEQSKKLGFKLNFHAEELSYIGGAEMGASLGAEAMSHLEEVSPAGAAAMAGAGSVGVLLPTTAFLLRLPPPPARTLIDAGVIVALGSDFNPNAHCVAMPIVMFLACVLLRLTPAEALVGATLNAAHALRAARDTGSIEEGKWADLLVIDAPTWEHLIYQLGSHEDLISHVIHRGKIVRSKSA